MANCDKIIENSVRTDLNPRSWGSKYFGKSKAIFTKPIAIPAYEIIVLDSPSLCTIPILGGKHY
jgi:hypothetical protein